MMISILKGLITIKDIEKQIKYPLSAKDEQGRLLCGAAVGITANVLDRVNSTGKCTGRCVSYWILHMVILQTSSRMSEDDQGSLSGSAGYRR